MGHFVKENVMVDSIFNLQSLTQMGTLAVSGGAWCRVKSGALKWSFVHVKQKEIIKIVLDKNNPN